jgi:hypothetical protein
MTASPANRDSACGASCHSIFDAEPHRASNTFFGWLVQGALFSLLESTIDAFYEWWVPWAARRQRVSRLRQALRSSELSPAVGGWAQGFQGFLASCVAGRRRIRRLWRG